MSLVKEWIKLGRPHTASLTIPGTLLGVVAAGAGDPWLYLWLGAWALGFHYFGFMHNNLCDLRHDKADPSKQHFPLVSGAIGERTAWAVWLGGTAAFYVAGVALLLAYGGNLLRSLGLGVGLGFLFMNLAVLAGIGYNLASKRTKAAPALISLSFASLPAYAFFVAGGDASNAAAWYIFAYGFVLMFHQIAYSGYLKDLAPDPVNWLRAWGARADALGDGRYRYTFTPKVQAWGWASRLPCPMLALAWAALAPGPPMEGMRLLTLVLILLWTGPLLLVFARLEKPGEWPRQRKVALMGTSEVLAYFILVASLTPYLGLWSVAFYAGPLVWYVAWNKWLWGTLLGPRV